MSSGSTSPPRAEPQDETTKYEQIAGILLFLLANSLLLLLVLLQDDLLGLCHGVLRVAKYRKVL